MSVRRAGAARSIGPARTVNTAVTGPDSYFAAQLADAPIAQWKMNEPSGTTMVDSSGNGHDGSYVGSLSLGSTVGAFTAPHFVNDWTKYAKVTNGAWMNAVDTAITLEALYYADSFNSYATIIGGDDMGASNRRAMMRWDAGASGPNWSIATSTTLYTMSGGPAGVTGAWYHGAMTYNGSVIKNYINGVEVNSQNATGTLRDWVPDIYIGRSAYTLSSYGAWNGYLCGIAWYETALSYGRITAHAQAAGLA